MGYPKGRSGSSSLWVTTGFKPRGRYNLISAGYKLVRVVNVTGAPLTVQEAVLNFCFVDDLAGSWKLNVRRRIL